MSRSKFEIKAQKELETDNWQVDYKIKSSGWKQPSNYNCDYFNLFDLMAYSPGIIRMIAIKGQGGVPGKLRKAIEDFKIGDCVVKEIWTYSQPTKKGKRVKSAKYRVRKEIIE